MSPNGGAGTTASGSPRLGPPGRTTWRHKLGTALRLRPREVLSTLYALALAASVELVIRWVPLPRLARLYGLRFGQGAVGQQPPELSVAPPEITLSERRRLRAAQRIMRNWPFGEGRCLRSSLVVGHLLVDHHPVLRVGVERLDDGIGAHAWLEIEGHAVLSDRGAVPFDAF